jgi:hypothetical protein
MPAVRAKGYETRRLTGAERATLAKSNEMIVSDQDGLPERIGEFLGMVIFAITCALLLYPIALHLF